MWPNILRNWGTKVDENQLTRWLVTVLFGAVTFFIGDMFKTRRIDEKDNTNKHNMANLERMVQGLNLTLSTLTVQVQTFAKEVEKLREMHDKVIRAEERILALERAKDDGTN